MLSFCGSFLCPTVGIHRGGLTRFTFKALGIWEDGRCAYAFIIGELIAHGTLLRSRSGHNRLIAAFLGHVKRLVGVDIEVFGIG